MSRLELEMERDYFAGDILEGVRDPDAAPCYVEPMIEVPVFHRCYGAHRLVVRKINEKVSVLFVYEVINGT